MKPLILLIIILIILYNYSKINIYSTLLGKLIIVILVGYCAIYSKLLGLLSIIVIIYICNFKEGMGTSRSTLSTDVCNDTITATKNFINTTCNAMGMVVDASGNFMDMNSEIYKDDNHKIDHAKFATAVQLRSEQLIKNNNIVFNNDSIYDISNSSLDISCNICVPAGFYNQSENSIIYKSCPYLVPQSEGFISISESMRPRNSNSILFTSREGFDIDASAKAADTYNSEKKKY